MDIAIGICLIILCLGLVSSNSGISKSKFNEIVKSIDKELSKEFDKRDKKIEELEKQVVELKEK